MRCSIILLVCAAALAGACGGNADGESPDEASSRAEERGTQEETPPSPDEESFDGEQVASGEGAQATETNFVPAVCLTDDDCPEGVRCVAFGDAGAGPGFCDLPETTSN